MNQLGGLASRLATSPAPIVAAGVVVGFAVSLLGVIKLGLPIWSLFILIAIILYPFLTLYNPTIGLCAVVCVFFAPIQVVGSVTLLQAVGATTACLLLVWFLYQQRTIFLGNILLPQFLLGILLLISFWYTRDADMTAVMFRKWVFFMILSLLLLNTVTRFAVFKKVIWVVMIMAALNAVVGIISFASSSISSFRSEGLMENPVNFGHIAVLGFPLALYQYLYRSGRIKWLGFGISIVLVGGVIVSVSRGAVVSLILVFLAILILERRRILPLLLVVALALAAVPFAPDYFNQRVGNLASDVNRSLPWTGSEQLTSRGYFNRAGINIWLAHPVLGVGIGNFGNYFVEREFNPGFRRSQRYPAHNIYIQALAETGTVGTLVLLWLIFLTLRNIIRARRRSYGDPNRWLYFGAIQMMAVAIFISTASYGNIMSNEFWLCLCLAAVARRVVEVDRDEANPEEGLLEAAKGQMTAEPRALDS